MHPFKYLTPAFINCAALFTEKDAAVDIARSGILPTFAQTLQNKSGLSCQVALVVAEMAREGRFAPISSKSLCVSPAPSGI